MDQGTVRFYTMLGAYFSGVLTVISVISALIAERYLARRDRPRLVLRYERGNHNDNRYVRIPTEGGTSPSASDAVPKEELWVRVRVKNESYTTTAAAVQVRLVSVKSELDATPDNLPSRWFKVANLHEVSIDIPPRFSQQFDLVFAQRSAEGGDGDLALYVVSVGRHLGPWEKEKARIEKTNQLKGGAEHSMVLAVVSGNADAKYYEARVRCIPIGTRDKGDGAGLGATKMREHIRIEIVGVSAVDI